MALRLSNRIVLPDTPRKPPCVVRIETCEEQEVDFDLTECCPHREEICIDEAADKAFLFSDRSGASYADAVEITFDVWATANGAGAPVLSKSLTGGGITIVTASQFRTILTNAESGSLTPGTRYYEVWVTNSGGDQYRVAFGPFVVRNTRKYD